MSSADATAHAGSLDRERLVAASFELVQLEGLEGLTMRALADRLGVKAASLYWHVRDRRELLELLATSLLDGVPLPDRSASWRADARGVCDALASAVTDHRDSARLLLEVPTGLDASPPAEHLRRVLETAGLSPLEASEATLMLLFHVVVGQLASAPPTTPPAEPGKPASLTIDTGSQGVTIRPGAAMSGLVRVPRKSVGILGATVTSSDVTIRRLRGIRRVDVELDPRRAWSIRVGGGTWNTRLALSGLDVRAVKIDGGATRIDCVLPTPRGDVPIHVSGGALAVAFHRPPGTAATASVSAGALQVRLDGFSTKAILLDARWESARGRGAPDRYDLRISGGAAQVSIDEGVADAPTDAIPAVERLIREPGIALELLLDGIERRVAH